MFKNKYKNRLQSEPLFNGSKTFKSEMRKFIDSFKTMKTNELYKWYEEYKNPEHKVDKFIFKCICQELSERY